MEIDNDFTINDLGAKCRSKSELYHLLSTEGGIYLPPMQDATQKYLRDIMRGYKLYLKSSDVKLIQVPQYKGLRVWDIIKFAQTKMYIDRYLPDYEYKKEPNRTWLCNVINSVIPDDFREYVSEKVRVRKLSLINSQNLCVKVKPEFLNIFKNSQSVSLQKGKSHFLARLPKKPKYQEQIDQHEEEVKHYEVKMIKLEQEIDRLKATMQDMIDIGHEDSLNTDKLGKLYELGIIDKEGNPINRDMI